jgi:hypothetical protein
VGANVANGALEVVKTRPNWRAPDQSVVNPHGFHPIEQVRQRGYAVVPW